MPAWPGGQRVPGTAQAEPLSAGMQPCLCQAGRSSRNPPSTPKGWESATLLQPPLPALGRVQSLPVPDVLPWPIAPQVRCWSHQAAGGSSATPAANSRGVLTPITAWLQLVDGQQALCWVLCTPPPVPHAHHLHLLLVDQLKDHQLGGLEGAGLAGTHRTSQKWEIEWLRLEKASEIIEPNPLTQYCHVYHQTIPPR